MPTPFAPLLAFLLLASCAPVIETTYGYSLPDTAEGRSCAARCEAERATCMRSCDRSERLCLTDAESRAMRDFQQEVGDPGGPRRGGTGRTYFDYANRYRSLCYIGGCRNACDETYRTCFEGCGGKVTATRVCTANCGS
ncbi:hypothetical protein [Azospirillum sp. sgz301742]